MENRYDLAVAGQGTEANGMAERRAADAMLEVQRTRADLPPLTPFRRKARSGNFSP